MLDQLETLIAFALIMLLLSLVIMTIVQSFNVALQRRGFNLLWGIEQILEEMGADKISSYAVAKKVLQYPAISADSWLGKIPFVGKFFITATAIRPEEFARVLGKILPADATDWQKTTLDAANALEKTLGQKLPDFLALSTLLHGLGDKLGLRALQALPTTAVTEGQLHTALLNALNFQANAGAQTLSGSLQSMAARVVEALNTALNPAPAPGQQPGAHVAIPTVDQIQKAIEAVFQTEFGARVARLTQKAADLKAWFDMVMDRTTERFVAWTRWVTIITSFVFCLVLRVDGLNLLHKLYSDKQVRATLVSQVDPAIKQAGDIMESSATAMATTALQQMKDEIAKQGVDPGKISSDLKTRIDGDKWLQDAFPDAAKRDPLTAKFHKNFDAVAKERLDELKKNRQELINELDNSQLEIFHISDKFSPSVWFDAVTNMRHLAGILLAGILLSLGAPFWFNTLKSLSNLRPILANRVQAEEQGTAPKK